MKLTISTEFDTSDNDGLLNTEQSPHLYEELERLNAHDVIVDLHSGGRVIGWFNREYSHIGRLALFQYTNGKGVEPVVIVIPIADIVSIKTKGPVFR